MKTRFNLHTTLLSVLTAMFFIVAAGCEKPLTQVELNDDERSVRVLTTSSLMQTENGVIIDGETVYRKSFHPDSSLYIHDESIYQYFTELEDIETQWIEKNIILNMELNRGPSMKPGDPDFKFVINDLDLGDVTLDGTPINGVTGEEVDYGDTPDSLLDIRSVKSYWYGLFHSRTTNNGRTHTIVDTPVKNSYLNNTAILMSGTGGTEIEPFSINVTFDRSPALTEMFNGESRDFSADMPNVSSKDDLVLRFDQPLKAGEAYITFIPLPRSGGVVNYNDIRKKAAFVSIIEDTDEVVIPSEVLQELRENSEISTAELYSLTVRSFTKGDEMTFHSLPESMADSYTFPVYTQGITDLFVVFHN